jgi:hypothetical protein
LRQAVTDDQVTDLLKHADARAPSPSPQD